MGVGSWWEQWVLSYRSQSIWLWGPTDMNNGCGGMPDDIRTLAPRSGSRRAMESRLPGLGDGGMGGEKERRWAGMLESLGASESLGGPGPFPSLLCSSWVGRWSTEQRSCTRLEGFERPQSLCLSSPVVGGTNGGSKLCESPFHQVVQQSIRIQVAIFIIT